MPLLFVKRKLTADQMIEYERTIKEDRLQQLRDKTASQLIDLAENTYNLEVDEDADVNRGALCPPKEASGRNGVIKLRKHASRFDVLHEILHYTEDVSVGEIVSTPFYEDYSPHTEPKDPNERKINYMAAAILMPLEEMTELIQKYDKAKPKPSILQFEYSLQEKYEVSRACVISRIQEVRKLMTMQDRI